MKIIPIPLSFGLTDTIYETKMGFKTADVNSAVLQFTSDSDPVGCVATLSMKNETDNSNRFSLVLEQMDVSANPFSYTLGNEIGSSGVWIGDITLKKNLVTVCSQKFRFAIGESLQTSILDVLIQAKSVDEMMVAIQGDVSEHLAKSDTSVAQITAYVNGVVAKLLATDNTRTLQERDRVLAELSRETDYQSWVEAVQTLIDTAVIDARVQAIIDEYQSTYAQSLLSVSQQLADTQADLQAGIGALTADAEVVTARSSEVKGRTFDVLDARLEEIETDHKTNLRKIISNDEPMHYDKVLGEYVNVGKYWDAYRDGKIYTTEFNNYEVSPSPTGTKKDANAGLVAVPSTNLVAGQDDYANIGLFKPVEVNAYVDANDDYHITAIKGDGRFKRDGTNGDVYIMNMLGYIKRIDTPTTWGYSYSDTLYAGFNALPEAVKPDGTVRPFLLHAKYIAGVGIDGKLASISGVNLEFNSMSHDGQITKFKAKGEQYSGKTTHDDFWMKLMLFLKYATTNSEAVMKGCISYYLQYQPSIYESGFSRVVLTNAQANALVVGSRVSIGNYVGDTKTGDRGSTLVHNVANRVKITSITALPDGLNSAVNVDAPAFDTNATTTITTVPWGSGACDSVLGNDGSPISNTSGKEPLIINGIETMVGGYEIIQNLMIYNDNTDPLDYKVKVYACYDAKLYKAGSPSADYKLLSVLMAQTNNTWQYISKLGVDPNHPTALIPVVATASSTTGFADGIYTNAPTTVYRVWLSLGGLVDGSVGGFFCVLGGIGLVYSDWGVLGRLSATGRSLG